MNINKKVTFEDNNLKSFIKIIDEYQLNFPTIIKKKSTGSWTLYEHNLYLKYHGKYGNNWLKIAKLIPTRTHVQIRTHHQKEIEKIKKTALILCKFKYSKLF